MSTTETKIKYTPDPQADLVLVIGDGTQFRVRRKYLDAASDVFEAMLDTSTDAQSETDAESGLPVVKLSGEDAAKDVDRMLRFVVRGQVKPDLTGMDHLAAASLWEVADKFGVEVVKELAVGRLVTLAEKETKFVFAFSLLQRVLPLARSAMPHLQRLYKIECRHEAFDDRLIYPPGHLQKMSKIILIPDSFPHSGWGLCDLPLEVFQKAPPNVIKKLFRLEHRVIYENSSWGSFAQDFDFD